MTSQGAFLHSNCNLRNKDITNTLQQCSCEQLVPAMQRGPFHCTIQGNASHLEGQISQRAVAMEKCSGYHPCTHLYTSLCSTAYLLVSPAAEHQVPSLPAAVALPPSTGSLLQPWPVVNKTSTSNFHKGGVNNFSRAKIVNPAP